MNRKKVKSALIPDDSSNVIIVEKIKPSKVKHNTNIRHQMNKENTAPVPSTSNASSNVTFTRKNKSEQSEMQQKSR